MKFFFNGLIANGIMYGVVLVIFFEYFTDFFGLGFEPSSEFAAVLLGAAISLSATILTIYASAEAAKENRNVERRAVATQLFIKFQTILNDLYNLRQHVNSGFNSIPTEQGNNPSLYVLSLTGRPDQVTFSPQEKILFIDLRLPEEANDVFIWDSRFNAVLRAFDKYSSIREELLPKLRADEQGKYSLDKLSDDEFMKAGPIIKRLDNLAHQIKDRLDNDYSQCREAFIRVKYQVEIICDVRMQIQVPE